jgi:DNA-binding transcriptional MocR family regulator
MRIDRDSGIPIYLQIARQLKQAILAGEPGVGERLPPERRLAALLGVNRTTIVNAYRELAADGLVSGQVGRGTIVTYRGGRQDAERSQIDRSYGTQSSLFSWVQEHDGDLNSAANGYERPRPAPLPWTQLFAPTTDIRTDPLTHEAMTVASRPDVIRFTTGTPSPELYPIEPIRALLDEALHSAGPILLQHTPTEGYPPLREAISGWTATTAARTGAQISVDPDQIVVVAGSQQALYLVARSLVEPGDLVAVESPTYLQALQVFRAAGARLLPIPIDQDGMNVDMLQDILPRRRPKLIYTLPTFQNPSGTVLSLNRRMRLLDLAARYQIPVIEDDPYGALRYDGRELPTLYALDRSAGRQNVIYLSTMSKILFPGFRIGWAISPKPVVERMTLIKQIVDLETNALAQWAVWAFIDRGMLQPHLDLLNAVYPLRRDRMLTAFDRDGHGLIQADKPLGGMYLWCRLSEGLRVRDLIPEAAREGVAFIPGEAFHVDASSGRGRASIRLNFTLPDEREIDEGIRRLGNALLRLAEYTDLDGQHIRSRRALTPIV